MLYALPILSSFVTLPAEIGSLTYRSDRLCHHEFQYLGSCGATMKQTEIDKLMDEIQKSDSVAYRGQCSDRICRLALKNDPALRQVQTYLSHKDRLLRFYASAVLGQLGARAKDAVPMLAEILSNEKEDKINRSMAASAIGLIGGEPGVAALSAALKSKSSFVRAKAAGALGRAEPTKLAIPHLVSALDDDNGLVRMAAVHSLEGMGSAALTVLDKLLSAKKLIIRVNAASALLTIRSTHKKAISTLVQLARHSNRSIRLEAIEGLSHAKGAAFPALPALIAALSNRDEQIRSAAAEVIVGIGAKAKSAESALIRSLKDKNEMVRGYCALALGEIRSGSKEAIAGLVDRLTDDEESVRVCAVRAIGTIGRPARNAAPALKRLLQTESPETRKLIREVLKIIGAGN